MLGVDRLSLSLPIEAPQGLDDWSSLHLTPDGQGGWAESRSLVVEPVKGCSVMVGARQLPNGWWGKVEGNPSRFMDPGGCKLRPVAEVLDAVGELLDVAAGFVTPSFPRSLVGDAVKVKRIDLARDLHCSSLPPAYYLDGLAAVHRPYAKRTGVWQSKRHAGAATLHAGSGAGMARLYDQHQAYAERGAVEGQARWEVECRGWAATFGDVQVVGDLTAERLSALAWDRWQWSGMGVEVAATDGVARKVMAAVEAGVMTETQARAFIGELVLRSCGLATRQGSQLAAQHRRWARELGIVLGAPLPEAAGAVRARLDLVEGRDVLVAA